MIYYSDFNLMELVRYIVKWCKHLEETIFSKYLYSEPMFCTTVYQNNEHIKIKNHIS